MRDSRPFFGCRRVLASTCFFVGVSASISSGVLHSLRLPLVASQALELEHPGQDGPAGDDALFDGNGSGAVSAGHRLMVEDEPMSYPAYCAKADDSLVPLRSIPPLTGEAAQDQSIRLLQVLTIVRHGARTPAGRYKCWKNYDPHWDCGVETRFKGVMGDNATLFASPPWSRDFVGDAEAQMNGAEGSGFTYEDRPYFPAGDANAREASWFAKLFGRREEGKDTEAKHTKVFKKRYDAYASMNVLGGTCQKGQLLAEGYQQHQILGSQLARAYQSSGSEDHIPYKHAPNLLDASGDLSTQIYFRASDMQRTLVSGSVLLSSMIDQMRSGLPAGTAETIEVHTMDLGQETLFPNTASCPALMELRDQIFASSEFAALKDKWRFVEEKMRIATGRNDIADIWPGDLFDCVLTTVCTSNTAQLPPLMRPTVKLLGTEDGGPKSLIDLLLDAVDDFAQFEYLFDDAAFSKAAVAYMVRDLKSEIVRALMMDLNERGLNATQQLSLAVGGETESMAFVHELSQQARAFSDSTGFDARKFVVFLGHDTTVMPFLASLGGSVFDRKWPPYAAQVTLEIYYVPRLPSQYQFRLIYNGQDRTGDMPGCAGSNQNIGLSQLCPIATFFARTAWGTPGIAGKTCGGATVSHHGGGTHWLL